MCVTARDLSNLTEAMAVLEAEAEVIMEMVGRREQPAMATAPQPAPASSSTVAATAPLAQPTEDPEAAPPPPPPSEEQGQRETPMDVDNPGNLSLH